MQENSPERTGIAAVRRRVSLADVHVCAVSAAHVTPRPEVDYACELQQNGTLRLQNRTKWNVTPAKQNKMERYASALIVSHSQNSNVKARIMVINVREFVYLFLCLLLFYAQTIYDLNLRFRFKFGVNFVAA